MQPSTTSQPSTSHLSLLLQLSQAFNSTLDLDTLLNLVMDEVITAVHAERGFVMLLRENKEMDFRVARGIDQTSVEDPQFQVSRSVIARVAQEGIPLLTSDAQSDQRFSSNESILIMGLRAILCVPLKLKEKLLGVIYVDNRVQAGAFKPEDRELLIAIANSAAIAIENTRLYRLAIEQARLEREMQMAHKVQASLLPAKLPQIPGWQFAARWQPAREVGGDYYDFITLDNNHLAFLVADVTDKGMPAALFMASTRSMVRASSGINTNPSEVIDRVNQLLTSESDDGLYVSMLYAVLNTGHGTLQYSIAGHNPPIHYCADKHKITELDHGGLWLGVENGSSYPLHTVHFEPGDFLVMITDGVTDAVNNQKEDFGTERLYQSIQTDNNCTADEIAGGLLDKIIAHIGEEPVSDDITILVVKRE
ncbi:MAG TPA: GAF domain-containing SpoIIE family protein phosphatase [Longilinea sp.]|nr:GAF domain-containing SpoIIE family protein phosphatase [Longilinea sp.]